MKREQIQIAIDEANRFISRANSMLSATQNDKWIMSSQNPKESGALRRASLDLTRQLAEMRRP